MLWSVQWCIGENEATCGSLSCRKETSASDWDRYPAMTSAAAQSWPAISTCLLHAPRPRPVPERRRHGPVSFPRRGGGAQAIRAGSLARRVMHVERVLIVQNARHTEPATNGATR